MAVYNQKVRKSKLQICITFSQNKMFPVFTTFFQINCISTIFKLSLCIIYETNPLFCTYNLQQTAKYLKKCALESIDQRHPVLLIRFACFIRVITETQIKKRHFYLLQAFICYESAFPFCLLITLHYNISLNHKGDINHTIHNIIKTFSRYELKNKQVKSHT